MPYILFIIGVALLTIGADRFVTGAQVIAKQFGVPIIIIGIVLVGFVTSVPEMLVAAVASSEGKSILAIGNVIGSNIANIGLVLGVSGLIRPLVFPKALLQQEFPILLMVSILVLLMILDGYLSRIDGMLLFGSFMLLAAWMVFKVKRILPPKDQRKLEQTIEIPKMSLKMAIVQWLLGLAVLLLGAKLTVDNAVTIARLWGLSELVIGLTIVAIGTSLPELATSIACLLKGEHDLVIGNVIGSNLFNMLPVLMLPALISPTRIPDHLIQRDYATMLGFTLLLGVLTWMGNGKARIGRLKAALLLISFIAYLASLFFDFSF